MKSLTRFVAAIVVVLQLGAAAPERQAALPAVSFTALQIVIDSGAAPLAAWQIRLKATRGVARIVGIEGGEHGAFADPPFYDGRAMQRDEVVVAAYSVREAGALPRGETRVVIVHAQVSADVEWQVILEAAATVDAQPIEARVELR